MVAAAALLGLAVVIAVLGLLGRRTGWWRRSGTFVLVVVALLFAIVAVIAVVTVQPGAFPSTFTFTGLAPGGSTPQTSFWGSDGSASWGAGVGWYLGAVSVGLLVGTLAVLVLAKPEGWAAPERRSRSAVAQPIARSYVPAPEAAPPPMRGGYTPPPPSSTYSRPAVTRPPISFASGTRVTPRPAPATRPNGDDLPDAPVSRAPPPPPRYAAPAPEMVACPACGTENLAKSKSCSYCQRSLRT
jgi:MFS family permease